MTPGAMICFVDTARRFTLATNYKVMYSTLLAQPQLTVVHRRHELRDVLTEQSPPITDHYLLVRDPYARLLSFHADKFLVHPPGEQEATVQGSHRVFFDVLGVETMAADERAAVFRATGFERFVGLLTPGLIASNVHLVPQSHTLALPTDLRERQAMARLWRPGRVLKMEEHLHVLQALGIDVDLRINATPHAAVGEAYSPDSYARVNDLYREDFRRFGYPTHHE